MSVNIATKLIIDAISIGVGAFVGIATAGIASPSVALGTRIALGATINTAYDLVVNRNVSVKEFAKNVGYATLSVGVAKASRIAEESILSTLGHEDLTKTAGKISAVKTTIGEANNKPLTSLLKVVRRLQENQKRANSKVGLGIGASDEDVKSLQLGQMEQSDEFMALDEEERNKIRKEINGDGDKKDMSDANESDNSNDMQPISVKFLLKPDYKKQTAGYEQYRKQQIKKMNKERTKLHKNYEEKKGQFKPFKW